MYGITTAETSHMEQITRRQKQYILTMLVRVVSILVVVCVPGFSWPLKVGLCLVAAIIPYVAVVRANGGSAPEKDPTNLLVGAPPREELGGAQRGLPEAGQQPEYIRADFFVKDDGTSGSARASTANGYRPRSPIEGETRQDGSAQDEDVAAHDTAPHGKPAHNQNAHRDSSRSGHAQQ